MVAAGPTSGAPMARESAHLVSRLVTVSNRVCLPGHTAPGGLAACVHATMRVRGGLWLGWNGQVSQSRATEITRDGSVTYACLSFSQREYDDFYLGFCNGTLWPLLHGFRARYNKRQYGAYQDMNQRYAHELASMLHPDDLIWVHDFQLLPLGQCLRDLGCTQPMGLFLHVPFPSPDALRGLPVAEELLTATRAYDLVGFQTEADRQAFRAAGGTGRTGVFPIGVDVDAIQEQAGQCHRVPGLMLGVDRLDYTKGLPQRITSYDQFLQQHPGRHGNVTLAQLCQLSREGVPAYAGLRRQLEQAVAQVNHRFGTPHWTPIDYRTATLPHSDVMRLLRSARVGIVTPLRDGMNLVAKEFIAAQDAEDPGVLILSEFAGAADELTSAVLVDPRDAHGVALAIEQALSMTIEERHERHNAMLEVLRRNSLQAWHTRFMDALVSARSH